MANKVIAIIGVGSNIEPEVNVKRAESAICEITEIIGKSTFAYTKPLKFQDQPDFLNGAFLISTKMGLDELITKLKEIEIQLGRTKTENKDGPRTIDLDVVFYDNKIVDDEVFKRDFLKKAVLELLPNLIL